MGLFDLVFEALVGELGCVGCDGGELVQVTGAATVLQSRKLELSLRAGFGQEPDRACGEAGGSFA